MNALPFDRRPLNALIPHLSPRVILNVVADLGLLLLVPGRRPRLLRLPPGPESTLVLLLPFFPFPLFILFIGHFLFDII